MGRVTLGFGRAVRLTVPPGTRMVLPGTHLDLPSDHFDGRQRLGLIGHGGLGGGGGIGADLGDGCRPRR